MVSPSVSANDRDRDLPPEEEEVERTVGFPVASLTHTYALAGQRRLLLKQGR